jgi:hypothetical protein
MADLRDAWTVNATLPDRVVKAKPRHGEDFCDACGDCLDCYWDDPCGRYGDEGHIWVIYEDQVVDFWANHPEATEA